jgi:hypothetical protein
MDIHLDVLPSDPAALQAIIRAQASALRSRDTLIDRLRAQLAALKRASFGAFVMPRFAGGAGGHVPIAGRLKVATNATLAKRGDTGRKGRPASGAQRWEWEGAASPRKAERSGPSCQSAESPTKM